MIYENEQIYVQKHESEIPWIKIFAKQECKELSECNEDTRTAITKAMLECEKLMLEFYKPDKINIASFGNYMPKVHIHVQARFQNDSYFPEPMWGVKQREATLELPNFEEFSIKLVYKMQELFG